MVLTALHRKPDEEFEHVDFKSKYLAGYRTTEIFCDASSGQFTILFLCEKHGDTATLQLAKTDRGEEGRACNKSYV